MATVIAFPARGRFALPNAAAVQAMRDAAQAALARKAALESAGMRLIEERNIRRLKEMNS